MEDLDIVTDWKDVLQICVVVWEEELAFLWLALSHFWAGHSTHYIAFNTRCRCFQYIFASINVIKHMPLHEYVFLKSRGITSTPAFETISNIKFRMSLQQLELKATLKLFDICSNLDILVWLLGNFHLNKRITKTLDIKHNIYHVLYFSYAYLFIQNKN